jgi:hypothetical protein
MGEAWHNNHHAFPTSAAHGMRPWEVDPSALVIRALEASGLAWDVQRITRERQDRRYSRASLSEPPAQEELDLEIGSDVPVGDECEHAAAGSRCTSAGMVSAAEGVLRPRTRLG